MRQLVRQLVNTMFISNNRPSFHLWWKENLAKHRKVSKYYETDCRLWHLLSRTCVLSQSVPLIHNPLIALPASKYKHIAMVDSIYDAQQSIMVRFSFMAGFTWCTTVSLVRSTSAFFSPLASVQVVDCITYLTSHGILFRFACTTAFSCMFEFHYNPICFIPMFHLFEISPSQCAPIGLAEPSTYTILVDWSARNLIAWPASPYRHFCFGFRRLLHFRQFIYVWVCEGLICFIPMFSFICNLPIPVCSYMALQSNPPTQF